MAANSVQICIQILTSMGNDTAVVVSASRFLANLFVHAAPAISAIETNLVPTLLNLFTFQIANIEVVLIAVKPIENMAYGSQGVRDYLKDKRTIEKLEEVKKANQDRQDVQDACNNTIYAINRTDYVGDSLEFVELNRKAATSRTSTTRWARRRRKVPEKVQEVPPKIKNFLNAGALLMKHSMTAPPRPATSTSPTT
jgi:hypothetical protein